MKIVGWHFTAILLTFTTISLIAQPTIRVVPGKVINSPESPIMLADASYEAREDHWPWPQYSLRNGKVKALNVSAKEIKLIETSFTYESNMGFASGGASTGRHWEHCLAPSEEALILGNMKMSNSKEKIDAWQSVRVIAVEFCDGTRWVAPRTLDWPLRWYRISQRSAPLSVWLVNSYSNLVDGSLTSNDENIVAYRLGEVKDFPNEYQTKMGRWVELGAPSKKNQKTKIKVIDEAGSFLREEIFAPQTYSISFRNGTSYQERGGVAFFVAEVRYADGHIWQQDLRREYLLWEPN